MQELSIDILENQLIETWPDAFNMLLRDHTTGKNIFWGTNDYEYLGDGYAYNDMILPELITGERGHIVKPRVLKSKANQTVRARNMAEVFTPSWVCNAQNNLIDEAWVGRENVFNTEDVINHTWKATTEKITFPEGKTWKDYVCATRIEITCGEAPYIVSRYDTTTGEYIPLKERIGLLDRKLRIVSENTETSGEWLKWAQKAFMNTYGYEWQGDNLLLSREALLLSFIEYYEEKFGRRPIARSIKYIAYIISWNLWQMDGLRGTVPNTCSNGVKQRMKNLFGEEEETIINCWGCQKEDIHRHNGVYCLIRDWSNHREKIRYVDLIK